MPAARPSVRVRALPLPNPKPVLLAWRDEGTEGGSEAGAPRFAIGGLRGEAPLRISLFPVSRASSARRREGGRESACLSFSGLLARECGEGRATDKVASNAAAVLSCMQQASWLSGTVAQYDA